MKQRDKKSLNRLIANRTRNESGALTAEASVSLAIFFLVVLGGIELGIAGSQYVSLHYSATRALRWATLNKQITDYEATPGNTVTLSRVRSIELQAKRFAESFGLDLMGEEFDNSGDMASVSICASSDPNFPNCATDNAGSEGELLNVTLSEQVRIAGINVQLSASATGQIEPAG